MKTFYITLFISILLIVGGFVVPPLGVIDGSVLTAVGLLLMFAALAQVPDVLKAVKDGERIRLSKGDFSAEVSRVAGMLCVACVMGACGCGRCSQVTAEESVRFVANHDTVRVHEIRYDSVFVSQSHDVDYRHGAVDTVYVRDVVREHRYRLLRDTIFRLRSDTVVRRDSVVVTAPARKGDGCGVLGVGGWVLLGGCLVLVLIFISYQFISFFKRISIFAKLA